MAEEYAGTAIGPDGKRYAPGAPELSEPYVDPPETVRARGEKVEGAVPTINEDGEAEWTAGGGEGVSETAAADVTIDGSDSTNFPDATNVEEALTALDEAVVAPVSAVGDSVATSETTTSATYADLTTPGPAATFVVPASGKVKVTVSATMSGNVATNATPFMAFALTGGNTRAANDAEALVAPALNPASGGGKVGASRTSILTGLTAGSTVFTAKYKQPIGGGNTATFQDRSILVEALP